MEEFTMRTFPYQLANATLVANTVKNLKFTQGPAQRIVVTNLSTTDGLYFSADSDIQITIDGPDAIFVPVGWSLSLEITAYRFQLISAGANKVQIIGTN
jgi:hypothetical protein